MDILRFENIYSDGCKIDSELGGVNIFFIFDVVINDDNIEKSIKVRSKNHQDYTILNPDDVEVDKDELFEEFNAAFIHFRLISEFMMKMVFKKIIIEKFYLDNN